MGGSAKRQVGRRIRRLRKSGKSSQQALATAIGVHVNTVARWESDGIDPHHPALLLIAAALHRSIEQLTGEAPKPLFIAYRANDPVVARLAVLAQTVTAYRARLAES